jgi:hypothetical protein
MDQAAVTLKRSDVSNFSVVAQNNGASAISSVSAGRDLVGGAVTIYGRGDLLLSAGRNMGPFIQSRFLTSGLGGQSSYFGMLTIGDGSNVAPGTNNLNNIEVRPYLPRRPA